MGAQRGYDIVEQNLVDLENLVARLIGSGGVLVIQIGPDFGEVEVGPGGSDDRHHLHRILVDTGEPAPAVSKMRASFALALAK